jgi:GcrA cell cycle regulator
MQLNWEEAHSAALRECLKKGMTFSEAARALNERFGTAYSRNAALGRARRMGLSSPERADRRARVRPPKPPKQPKPAAARLHKLRERARSGSPAKVDVRERAAALQLRCVAIIPRHLALVELGAGDCRYPYGGDAESEPITFCGHPRRDGSSYCVLHFHLTSAPEVATERVARARAPLRLVEAA